MYTRRDPQTAVSELSRWSENQIDEAIRGCVRVCTGAELKAAAMLHTELACAVIDTRGRFAAFQFDRARQLLTRLLGASPEPADVRFVQRWFDLAIGVFISRTYLAPAERMVNVGLELFPRYANFHVARAAIRELPISFEWRDMKEAPLDDRRAALRATRELESAAAECRTALSLDPRNAMARIHLGWIHFVTRDSRARDDLAAAIDAARTDREIYLAHLFQAALDERDQRWPSARSHYDAALQAQPRSQSAHIGLSHVYQMLGQIDASREQAAFAFATDPKDEDPWWTYHVGGADEELFNELRVEVQKPSSP
jgi:tetratricopeptide (TPR) repeat protein